MKLISIIMLLAMCSIALGRVILDSRLLSWTQGIDGRMVSKWTQGGGGWTPISGLVAHWKMNDNSANTTVVDNVGSGSGTAQQNTDVITSSGKINGALTFNGISDYIMTGLTLDLGTNGFTISFWDYVPSGGGTFAFALDNEEAMVPLLMDFDLGTDMGLYITSGATWDIAAGRSFGTHIYDTWYMVSLTRDGTTFTMYLNGVQVDQWDNADAIKSPTSAIRIGFVQIYYHSMNQGGGKLDDVRIYDRGITSNEVFAIWNNGNGTEAE